MTIKKLNKLSTKKHFALLRTIVYIRTRGFIAANGDIKEDLAYFDMSSVGSDVFTG